MPPPGCRPLLLGTTVIMPTDLEDVPGRVVAQLPDHMARDWVKGLIG